MSAPWRIALDASLAPHADDPTSRYVSFATIALDGRPAVRTLVFRGFTAGDGLVFTADARSTKVAEIARDRRIELCWYFPRTREQYRLTGSATILGHEGPEAALVWRDLSDAVRSQFFWPAPGAPWLEHPAGETAIDLANPPDAFVVLAVEVARVDRVDLRDVPPNRRLFETSGAEWTSRRIQP